MKNLRDFTIQDMVGLTPINIHEEGDEIIFYMSCGTAFKFYPMQDCCEVVSVEDVSGDWADLIGHPLLVAEEREGDTPKDYVKEDEYSLDQSYTWTFYTFRGIKGTVDVRWLGESNGYYSESVDLQVYSIL